MQSKAPFCRPRGRERGRQGEAIGDLERLLLRLHDNVQGVLDDLPGRRQGRGDKARQEGQRK
jgi:hypothetical protein